MPSPDDRSSHGPPTVWVLYLLIALGLVLRLVVLFGAEHRLDADEAMVGVMALDILEGQALPLFFYGTAYNGGGALEAYLGAAIFALFGPSAMALKLGLLALWLPAALLLADLCRRALPRAAVPALLFFCIGTPFFVEWSLKARGGFAETVLFGILLLWIAEPPHRLHDRPVVQGFAFGVVTGAALWASEMILAMIPLAAIWLVLRQSRANRRPAIAALVGGAALGLAPLLWFNLTHDWSHARQSVLLAFLRPDDGGPMTAGQMELSAEFVLGPVWPLLLAGGVVAGVRLFRVRGEWNVGHVVCIHVLLYTSIYWLSGLRFLPVPPSRVLYALYPGLAILLGIAVFVPRPGKPVARLLAGLVIAVWLVSVALPTARWIHSGEPRETGSWRGSWSLTDGAALRVKLIDEGVRVAYCSHWTRNALLFAVRSATHRDPQAAPLWTSNRIPDEPPPRGAPVALVLREGAPLIGHVERTLRGRVPFRRTEWRGFVILSGIDSSQIHTGFGLPAALSVADWREPPDRPDGFN